MAHTKVNEPFPISAVAGKYFLYDADVVIHVRRQYYILGVFIGTLPQASQQNVFLGLPLELMPEEARLLVDKGVAYVVDDVTVHKNAFLLSGMSKEEKLVVQRTLERQGRESAVLQLKKADERKENALRKVSAEKRKQVRAMREKMTVSSDVGAEEDDLFSTAENEMPSRSASRASSTSSDSKAVQNSMTPATSYPGFPLHKDSNMSFAKVLPEVPPSFPLFRYLNSHGYYISPGMRFGCHYSVYPGDSLRYHSHFLAVGKEWDEDVALLELVGGGRLGTGVKKGFCVGGAVQEIQGNETGEERAFVIEWAGM